MYNPYYGDKNFNFGDEDDNDDEVVDYIKLDEDDDCELEENEWGAYDFESNGPNSGYNVNELEDNTINSYEPMQSAFDDDDDMDDGSETVPSFNPSGEYLGMVEPNGDMEIDDDLKESFFIQKNKITEMFNRFNKYN